MINQNHQSESSIINGPPTGHPDIESTTFPPTSVPTSDPTSDPMSDPTSDPMSDPTSDPTSTPTSAASETTVDREGDGRIREGLESLGGR